MKKFVCVAVTAIISAAATCVLPACVGEAEVEFSLSSDGSSYIVKGVEGDTFGLSSYEIPATYNDGTHGDKPVTEIGDDAFKGCGLLRKITIPDTVKRIGVSAFALCDFEEVTIPDSVTEIAGFAFYKCDSLKTVTIPASVVCLGKKAFAYCSNLETAVIKAQVELLDEGLFMNSIDASTTQVLTNTSLTKVYLPSTLKKINYFALYGNFISEIYFAGSEQQWDELYFYETVKDEEGNIKEEKKEKDTILPKNVKVTYNVEF